MRIMRGEDPGPFSRPRAYVSHLRTLFRFRCAYCLTPDERLGGEEAMKVDHFQPESRHPQLRLQWSNLYYSCDVCNNRKSDHPTAEEVSRGLGFVDPCIEDPDDHFAMIIDPECGDFCLVKGLSHQAEYTIERLDFNRRRFLREFWQELDKAEKDHLDKLSVLIELSSYLAEFDVETNPLWAHHQGRLEEIRSDRPFPRSR